MGLRTLAACVLCTLTVAPLQAGAQRVVRENLAFLSADGRSAVVYSTVRSDFGGYRVFLDESESPDDFSYIYPPDFDREQGDDGPVMRFYQGDYATLQELDWSDRVTVGQDGIFTYESWDGDTLSNGHFGHWQLNGDYRHFVHAWVFPENMEIVSHESNRQGRWITRGRTLMYFGEGVNDITFTVRYRPVTQGLYAALEDDFRTQGDVSVEQDQEGILLTLDDAVLFPSGSADLTEGGRSALAKVARTLATDEGVHVAIQGHTDSVPVQGELTATFATNWELSAARSLAVLHALMDLGVPEDALEVRAFAATQPVADNDTAEGRADNRRVELRVPAGPHRARRNALPGPQAPTQPPGPSRRGRSLQMS